MAYQTGTYTTIDDLISTLFTFLTTGGVGPPGWMNEELDTAGDHATISKGNCFVSFGWNAGREAMNVWQSTGFTNSSTDPWNHTGDSGTGPTQIGYDSQRAVNYLVANGNYWFFEDDTYCHVVVEPVSGVYRHFGFGNIDKIGTWTGGEYAYAGRWDITGSSSDNLLDNDNNGTGWSPRNTFGYNCATMRVVDLVEIESDVNTVWGVVGDNTINDRAGNPRLELAGGTGGYHAYTFQMIPFSENNANKTLAPMPIFAIDTSASPDNLMLLGHVPDTRIVNLEGLTPESEISDGSDTWTVFPWCRKRWNQDNATQESGNAGIAYKKVTT